MAVLAAEAIAALVVAGASVVVPAAAAGVTYAVACSKFDHVEAVVEDRFELTAGTHISYKYKDGTIDKFSYRHAIVAEDVDATDGHPTKLIYWFDGQVICDVVQLTIDTTGTGSCPIYRHQYNCSISYGREAVADRARSLCTEYVRSEWLGVVRNYWSCFDDDKEFAVWCHTGVHFTRILHGMFSTDFKYVKVSSISCLRPGDHICFRSGDSSNYQHGIVVDLNGLENTVTVTCKKKCAHLPQTVTIQGAEYFGKKSRRKLYRYDYDIAVGHCDELTVRNALNETRDETRCNGPSVYETDVDFAVWCKLSVVISPNDASTLAKARVASCLHATVRSKTDLRPGDHLEYSGQHLIVEDVSATTKGAQLTAILMPNVEPGTGSGKKIIQKTYEKVENDISRKRLEKYFYDIAESTIDERDVVRRARQHLGEEVDELPFKDSQHFAIWCRTGARQLHCQSSEERRELGSRKGSSTGSRRISDGRTSPAPGDPLQRYTAGDVELDTDSEEIVLNDDEDDDEDLELFRQNLRQFNHIV